MLALVQEFLVILGQLLRLFLDPFIELILIQLIPSQVCKNPSGIPLSLVEHFCTIHHHQGALTSNILIFLKHLAVVNSGELSCHHSDAELTVAVQILESRLVLPDFCFLLEQ